IEVGAEALDSPGYDLLGLAIGSEGMLIVVTEVTVRLLPKPQCARVVMASFDDVEKAGEAVAEIIAAGIIPAGLEMMDRPATRAVEQFVGAGYDLEAAAILLCESDGAPAVLVGAQGGLSGSRAHLARLLLHGRHHPAQAPGRSAALHRRARKEVRLALPERVSCGRRQPAPADPVRRQQRRGAASHRAIRCRGAGEVRRGRRHDHRRARRRRREDQPDVYPVSPGGARAVPRGEACLRRPRAAQSRQGGADARALRRIRPHARPRWRAAAPGAPALLTLVAMQDQIRSAAARAAPLRLRGGGSKDFYGHPPRGELLDTRGYAGIVDYEPSELVLSARAGTPLADIEQALAE